MDSKYPKFIASRALGTGVDTLVLWLISHLVFKGGSYWTTYIIAPFISFEAAVMSNFLCSYFWIWSSRVTHRSWRSFWRHFIGFNLSAFLGFIIKMLFLLLFERLFGWSVVVCNLAALCISGVFNFLLTDKLIFRNKRTKPSHQLLSVEELSHSTPLFRGPLGSLLAKFSLWLCGVGNLNRLYDHIYDHKGPKAARAALEYIGCDYLVGNAGRLKELPEGAFITVSNHPYGGIDGVILLDMIGHQREDLKIMVNKILGRVEPMRGNFITVSPTETVKMSADATTLQGIRTTISHLHNGHPLSLFPSGAVSNLHLRKGTIADRPWQDSIIRLIQKAKVPIVPIHFEGHNSKFYYLLGVIDWRIRLLRLPGEVLNKHKGIHRVNIGATITPEEQQKCDSCEALGELLRKRVYGMPEAERYTPSKELIGEWTS